MKGIGSWIIEGVGLIIRLQRGVDILSYIYIYIKKKTKKPKERPNTRVLQDKLRNTIK
jgi:hypothetical protein